MQHTEHQQKALFLLRSIRIGESLPVSQLITRKGGEGAFKEVVKQLIDMGYREYEFSDDYTAIRRLDLPDFAIKFFKEWKD